MPKKRVTRVYRRGGRFWGDFRDYSPEGGKLEALRVPGAKVATDDPDVAVKLAADRVTALEKKRRGRGLGQEEREPILLGAFAQTHLDRKAIDGEGTVQWLKSTQKHLESAVAFFGKATDLERLTPNDFTRWVDHLRAQKSGRGDGTLTDATVRQYLNSLSNLFARAVSDHGLPRNPVRDMYTKPSARHPEAAYLEPEEVALLLESARLYRPAVDAVRQPHGGAISAKAFAHIYPYIATLALTGARMSEAAGLLVDDVSLKLNKVYIRPNEFRRLKTRGSKRTIPLWPQLREILATYFAEREKTGGLGTLLFPGRAPKPKKDEQPTELMVSDVRKALDEITKRAGLPSVRPHALRHTYTAARIQTCDRGRPIAMYSVARELGHSSLDMIADVYGHLHDRAEAGGTEVVEFRIEHYREKLGERLRLVEEVV